MKKRYPYLRSALVTAGRCLLLALLLLVPVLLRAQTYTMPTNGANAFTTCAGTLYDDGGPNGAYSVNLLSTTTLTPATAGSKLRLEFTEFVLEDGSDFLTIYDGSSANAPVIGVFSGQSPGTVYATNSAGTLTLRLSSNNVFSYSGFAATISCVSTLPLPDLGIRSEQVQPQAATPGESVTASCIVVNISGRQAASSSVGYYLSTDATLSANDALLGSSTGGPLTAGSSAVRVTGLTIPAGTAVGSYYILFAADYQAQVPESDETNNVVAAALSVLAPNADLVVPAARLDQSSSPPGGGVPATCYLQNVGTTTAASSTLGYYLSTDNVFSANDVLLTTSVGGALGPNGISPRVNIITVPPTTAPGSYFVLFVADPQNEVPEANELNNVATFPLTVPPSGPDLVVQSPFMNPINVAAGNLVTVSSTLANVGNQTATAATLGYYLSPDATLSASDVLLGNSVGGPLAAGGVSTRVSGLTIPAGTASGTYYLLFVADYQAQVPEANEQNNVAALQFSVIPGTVDLLVSSAQLSSYALNPGGSVQASTVIYNQGNSAAGVSTLRYYLSPDATLSASDVLLASSPVGAVGPAQNVPVTANVTIPAGTAQGSYYMLFVADALNVVAETNEQNNVRAVQLSVVGPGIDLAVSQLTLSRTTAPTGGQLTANAFVVNLGSTASPASNIGFYLSTDPTLDAGDVLLAPANGGPLAGGTSSPRTANLAVPPTTAPGSYYVLGVADYLNQVTETNEQNNVASTPLTVTPGFTGTLVPATGTATITTCNTTIADPGGPDDYPNFANGSLTINPATAGNKIRLTFTVLQTEACCDRVTIYDGPTTAAPLLGSFTSLPPAPITASAGNASGALTVSFTSDNAVVAPGFEATVTCISLGPPDLVVQQPTASLTTVAAGSIISLGGTVFNQGSGEAVSSQLGYYLSTDAVLNPGDVSLGTSSGGALPNGVGVVRGGTFSVPTTLPAGSYYILYVADPQNLVVESDETNNVATRQLIISAAAPDLTLAQPTLTPASVVAGTTVSVTCLLSNQGSTGAAASTVGFYLSPDNALSANDVLLGSAAAPALGVGSALTRSAALLVPAGTAPGSYYVLYVADYLGVVAESDETNNVISRALTVTSGTATQDQLGGLTLSVYPNPAAHGQFAVQLKGPGAGKAATLTLYNALGQTVARQVLAAGPGTVQFSPRQLPAGVYLLRLTGENLHATRRIVVE